MTICTCFRYACCIHGQATFPQWHRLYTVQVEDGLRRHGSLVGIPYWDWTSEFDALPTFLTDANFTDEYTGAVYDNPFSKATIDFENAVVERDVQVGGAIITIIKCLVLSSYYNYQY